MSSIITAAKVANAYNFTEAPSVAADQALFGLSGLVCLITDLPTPATYAGTKSQTPVFYTVLDYGHHWIDLAGSTEMTDQGLAAASDGVTARAAAAFSIAFNHGGTPVGTTAATVTSRPHFYKLQNEQTGAISFNVAQCLMTNEAGIAVYVAAQTVDWNNHP